MKALEALKDATMQRCNDATKEWLSLPELLLLPSTKPYKTAVTSAS
ncbi:MAG: hypothetical protein ACREOZ_05255 [Gloeomargaritales cyanobacterium]